VRFDFIHRAESVINTQPGKVTKILSLDSLITNHYASTRNQIAGMNYCAFKKVATAKLAPI
jgi:hypothetical protein